MKNCDTRIGIGEFERAWGNVYKNHPLGHMIGFMPTSFVVATGSRTHELHTNNLQGEIVSGRQLDKLLRKEGMVHPIIISINGVGDDYYIRLDCGNHRARVAFLVANLSWIPCLVEVSHSRSAFIRSNGSHEYSLSRLALATIPDIKAQFMSPDRLFSRFELEDIDGAENYIDQLSRDSSDADNTLKAIS